MSARPLFTYQTRIRVTPEQCQALDAFAALYGKAERKLFADIAAGQDSLKIKSAFMQETGLSARQYNAVRVGLQGKIDSIKESRQELINESEQRIKKLVARIKKLSLEPGKKKKPRAAKPSKPSKPEKVVQLETVDERRKRLFKLHHVKRKLATSQVRHKKMLDDVIHDTTRLCFGSKKLFNAQFYLKENGYQSHAAWKKEWTHQRSNQLFVLGSKDESSGCQGCQASVEVDGSISLQLRLPDEIGENFNSKHLNFSGLRFAYGHSQILNALATSTRVVAKGISGKFAGKDIIKRTGTAISYRFVRDTRSWRVFVSTQAPEVAITTLRSLGAIGVDMNADHLAVSHTDRFGNLVGTMKAPTVTYGKSQDQAKAIYGDAAVLIAHTAKLASKPVVIEKLDFQKKKSDIGKGSGVNPRKARMLSSFAYNKAASSIKAACFRAGVQVIEVNPAYTSVIGAVNHAQARGLSVHLGAAVAIARRGLGLSERPTVRTGVAPARNGGHVTFELPVRNRSKHVWSHWSAVRTNLQAAHEAHFRCGGHKEPPPPLPCLKRPAPNDRWMRATGVITVRPRDASGSNCESRHSLTDVPL